MDERGHRYELVERIAVGGMAEVFLAKTYGSHGFEKTLAIKRILPDLAASPEFERRFIAEAKIAVTLSHANIVQVLDFSRFGDSLYIAMEYVDGLDLAALLRASPDQQLPVGAALHVATEMLKGLDFAHRRGVVHRDVSPSNVLVSRAGEVKIADFGIALATQGSSDHTGRRRIMGKWRYMSPEQTRGDDMDARSDLFSAATVMFEVFTGVRLFPGDDAEAIVRNILTMELPRAAELAPGIPAAIDDVLSGMLERDPERRTARAADALSALVDISYSQSVQATAMNLARVADEVMPPPRRVESVDRAASTRLIDDILNSELKAPKRRERTRVTLDDARMPTFATADLGGSGATGLSFVGGTRIDGVTNWILEPTIGGATTLLDEPVRRPEGTQDLAAESHPIAIDAAARAIARPRRRWLIALGVLAVAGTGAALATVAWRTFDRATVTATTPAPTPRETPGPEARGPTPAEQRPTPEVRRAKPDLLGTAGVTGGAAAADSRPSARAQPDRRTAARTGTIDLYVEPWADVYHRGKKIGTAPQRGLKLPVGRQRLRLVNPVQGRATSITVTVPGERPYRVTLP